MSPISLSKYGHHVIDNISDTTYCSSCCCVVDGGWSSWGEWSRCSTSCEEGIRERDRECDNPTPDNGGIECIGDNKDTKSCVLLKKCPGKMSDKEL